MAFKKTILLSALAVIALSAAVLTSAFKPTTPVKQAKMISQQWYSITPTSNTDPTLQVITGSISAPPVNSSTDCAQFSNFGNYCGVLLQFTSTAPSLSGKTVQQAITQNGATIVNNGGSPGYSRLP